MRRFSRKSGPTLSRSDALDCRPVKNAQVEEVVLDTGALLLSYPIRIRPWASALLRRFGMHAERTATKKLELDALGTSVWRLLDGRRTVRQVVHTFSRTHQLHPKEAEVAVSQFIRELGRRGLVGLK